MNDFENRLLSNGYKRINSNAQAYEVIKRRVKHYRKNNDRSGNDKIHACYLDGLDNIKIGSYYKFSDSPQSKRQALFVWSINRGNWCSFIA